MALKIYIKQQVVLNQQGQPVIYTGLSPQTLQAQVNTPLPNSRQWPQYGTFIDATGDVSDLTKLELSWKAAEETKSKGEYTNKKSASGTLTFEGETFQLIKQWLIDDVSASLNAIHVNIHDTDCDIWYNDYSFNNLDVRYCEDVECLFEVTLRQKEDPMNCIRNTVIYDNWQGWFTGDQEKRHPRFSYCNEQRPNGLMVLVWFLAGNLTAILLPILIIILPIIWAIMLIVNVIISIIAFLGGAPDPFKDTIPDWPLDDIIDSFGQFFIESGGCGREHPAPLIRDYISNVCAKCGIQVDASSAPIFFATQLTLTTASRGEVVVDNPHYNATLFAPIMKRGVRRFKTMNFTGQTPNQTTWFIPGNVPVWSLSTLLDWLKPIYNASWFIENGKLYFKRKDFFTDGGYVYDFSTGSPDRNKLLEGVCLDWNEVKYPAYITGLYQQDPADKPGNEIRDYYNDIIDVGKTSVNPNFEGELDKYTDVGATKFRLDGASEDYIYDAFQIVTNLSFFNLVLPFVMFGVVAPAFRDYADYAILLDGETCSIPKLVLWDGASFENARAIKPYACHDNTATTGKTVPPINSAYNGDAHRWQDRHPPDTFVRGSGLSIPPSQAGYYLVTGLFGAYEIKREAMLPNYFMYFAQDFQDTMWDWFHWIDDPNKNPKLNMSWSVKIDLCCEDLRNLNVGNGSELIALNGKVKLPTNFYTDGKIKEITVSYDVEGDDGAYIEIKGEV